MEDFEKRSHFPEKGKEEEKKVSTLRENLGVSFQGEEGKERMDIGAIKEQFDLIKRNKIDLCQFHLSEIDDQEQFASLIKEFRENDPDISISLHASTPVIKESSSREKGVEVDNEDEIREEIEMANKGDLITVHPLSAKYFHEKKDASERNELSMFRELSEREKNLLVNETARFYAELIGDYSEESRNPIMAIENVGQNIDEMRSVLDGVRELLVSKYGMSTEEPKEAFGVTLDINHVLSGNKERSREVVEEWVKAFKEDIKCFHISVPKRREKMESIMKVFNEIYSVQSLNVPVYLESKRSMNTTEDVLSSTMKRLNEID